MELTPEQLLKNWETHLGYISTYITGGRKDQLVKLYTSLRDEMVFTPASGKPHFHNAFTGGYIEHVNRVVELSLTFLNLWEQSGANINFTKEELVFSALNHDLGKVGLKDLPNYLPQTNNWRKENLGEMYTYNPNLPFMLIQDRSLYTLQSNGIILSENEYFAIKLHDGVYEDVNKPYYLSNSPDSKLRSNITHILHQADFLASKVEYDRWVNSKSSKK